jgi:WD40 repeat protein
MGNLAVIHEMTPMHNMRGGIWNLSTGKLERYLSEQVGKGTEPYAGREDADFGAEIDGKSVAKTVVFSPHGSRVAALRKVTDGNEYYSVSVWDVATGELLSESHDVNHVSHIAFPHEDYLVIDTNLGNLSSLIRVHVPSGASSLVMPRDIRAAFYPANASHEGKLLFIDRIGLNILDPQAGELVVKPDLVGGKSSFQLCSVEPDGKSMITCTAQADHIEHWDLTSGKRSGPQPLIPPPAKVRGPSPTLFAASEARLLVVQTAQGAISFYNCDTAQLTSTSQAPFQGGRLVAISSNGRRLVLKSDQNTLLIVEWLDKLPEGHIDLHRLLDGKNLPDVRE